MPIQLSEEEVELIEKIWIESNFKRDDLSRLVLDIFRSCGLPRNIPYERLKKTFYLKRFENNKNLIYATISATLYSFSILSTLLIMSGSHQEEELNFSRKIAEKIAKKISRELNDGYKNENLETFFVESFYLSLLAQMHDDKNNQISLEAMFHLHDFQCAENLLDGDKKQLKNSGAIRIGNGEEAPTFQFLADILGPICKKNKIGFDREVSSHSFNEFMEANLRYPFNPVSLLCQNAIVKYGTPLIFLTLTTLYWRNYINLPYTMLAAFFLGCGFKHIKRSIGKSLRKSLKEGTAKQISIFKKSIEERQDFLVAKYEQREENQQAIQPPLLFTPMRTEESELTLPKCIYGPYNLYTEQKTRTRKSSQEARQKQEKTPTKTKLKRNRSTLPEYYYPTNYRNQVVVINPSHITTLKGGPLDPVAMRNISFLMNAATLSLYRTTSKVFSKFDCKLKRGSQDRTPFRVFANRTKEKIDVEGRGTCQVYEAVAYSPTH